MSFDSLENWLNSELQEETTSAPAATVQTVVPDSPDMFELFTEDGICLAEIGCSMDYWDDGDVAPPPEIDDSLGSQAGVTAGRAKEGYNYILAELELLYRLICPLETQDGVQAPLGSQAVAISHSVEGYNDVLAELELLDHLIFEMDGENGGTPILIAAASPPSHGNGVRAPAAVRQTGIFPEPVASTSSGPSSGPVNQKNLIQKAASSVFTYLVQNPDDQAMMNNLKFYSSLPEVDMNKIVNFEVKDYVPLYIHGSEAYRNEDFRSVIGYIEESLDELLKEEEECRAFCEGPFDQGWFPDFVSSISNHFTFCLKCKLKCSSRLSSLNGEVHSDLLPSHYHFLQFAYYKVNNLQKSCEAVSSYLLFFPNDETMLSNKKFYLKMPEVKMEYFNPRKEAINYIKRQQYEEALLKYIEKEFTFEDSSDNEVSPSDSMKDESF